MKLSEFKNEEALDVLAEIIEPVFEICKDKEIAEAYKENKILCASLMLKNHKSAVLAILAALERKKPEEFECNLFTLPIRLLEILADKDLVALFTSQSSTGDVTSAGSVSGNTTAAEA